MSKEKQKLHLAEEYARRVRSGEILACEYVRLAVGRYYRDLDMALDRGWFLIVEKRFVPSTSSNA